ncbi:MAG: LicD family protein [Flavobacteriaceae bacterium]|nr:LicD family protein [Flavobacteriaceae bacterium]
MAYNIKLTGKNLIEAEMLICEVSQILNQLKFPYALEGGTLLGIHRDGHLLPWDNDVDFSMQRVHLPEMKKLDKVLNQNGFRLRVRYFKTDQKPFFKKGDIRILKIRKKKWLGLLKGKVALDVFIKYQLGQNLYWLVGDGILKSCPVSFYEKEETIHFKGIDFPTPSPIADYLAHRYGNWKKPEPIWNTFENDKSIVRGDLKD